MTGGVGEASAAKPPPQTDAEVLAWAVAALGPRFGELLDPGHPDHDPRYRPHVRALASPAPPAAAPFDPALNRAMARCPDRLKADCGCAWPFRCRRRPSPADASGFAPVSQADCHACLRARPLDLKDAVSNNCSGEATPPPHDGGASS